MTSMTYELRFTTYDTNAEKFHLLLRHANIRQNHFLSPNQCVTLTGALLSMKGNYKYIQRRKRTSTTLDRAAPERPPPTEQTQLSLQTLNFTLADRPASALNFPTPATLGILVVIALAATAFAILKLLNSPKKLVSFFPVRLLAVVVVPWKILTSQPLPSAVLHCLFVVASGEPNNFPRGAAACDTGCEA